MFLVARNLNAAFTLTVGPPYSETTLFYNNGNASVVISGILLSSTRRCDTQPSVQGNNLTCLQGHTYREYGMLSSASVSFPLGQFSIGVELAPTLALAPRRVGLQQLAAFNWSTAETATPTQIP